MGEQSAKASSSRPSSNWLALQKKLPSRPKHPAAHARKKRKIEHESSSPETPSELTTAEPSFVRGSEPSNPSDASPATNIKNGESIASLRKMVRGELTYSPHQEQPGKYLSLDCEMVGVGINGEESSLARVSLVNYYGAVQMDEFVRQRERVVDYRTQYSGIRPSDMVHAKPFLEVQKQVAELLKDRILVGHAVHNDLKALLLSHPHAQTRDTQVYAGKHKVTSSRRPALRHLVKQELGIAIQDGEHSSVTDARATMAVFRLHRKDWDKSHIMPVAVASNKKRKRDSAVSEGDVAEVDVEKKTFPGGGRKGISSGLSTVVNQRHKVKRSWWKELGGGSDGSKGSIKLKSR